MRLKGSTMIMLGALLGIVVIYATDQVVPASTAYQAQLRIWLAARATGVTALLLLTAQVALGLILSHPTNQSTWKLSKRLFPWHENLLVFTLAFLAVHVVFLVLDPYAGVGLGGALIPGLSAYRSAPVAIGVLALYALLITGLTARYPKKLPTGWWLKLHRFAFLVLIAAWLHGILAGTDSDALRPLYIGIGLVLVLAAAYRYWVTKRSPASFSARRDAEAAGPAARPAAGPAATAGAAVRATRPVLPGPLNLPLPVDRNAPGGLDR
jgi:DMSO/TMAO reductase YedYZ heme-binding membrane subunit